jgi:hypothetical protein
MLSRAIRGGKCFLTQKLPLKTAAAQQNHSLLKNLVAGAGFEPAVRQLPDYELRRCKPVMA